MSESAIEGERGPTQVTATRKRLSQRNQITLSIVCAAAFLGFVYWKWPPGEKEKLEKTVQTAIGQVVNADMMRQADPPAPAVVTPPTPAPAPQLQPLPQPPPGITLGASRPPRMLSFAPPPALANTAASAGQQENTATGVAYKGETIQGQKAGAAIDQTYLLMPGVYHCTLDTAINSDVEAGPFLCHTEAKIRSRAGVTLMEQGTIISGLIKNEHVQQGQSRIPALAITAYTPNGVPVPLNSPMTDGLGRAGFEGEVFHHYGERFGAAAILLLSQGALNAAQASLTRGSGNTYLNLQGGGMEQVISDVLRSTINIPPTIVINQGSDVAFFITAPVDFSAAYRLRVVR